MEPPIAHDLVLPPGFQAFPAVADPWGVAIEAAGAGADPGSIFWTGAEGHCRAAIILTPDRPPGADTVRDLGLLALFDALAVLAPPQLPLQLLPDGVSVDGARVAALRAIQAAGLIPAWAVLGFDVTVNPASDSPGNTPDQTSLLEEGFGDTSPADVLMQTTRHLLAWVDTWSEEGATALSRAVARYASLEYAGSRR